MIRPKLTIGMATYDDYDGAWFTLQSLRLNNDLSQVELIVVDNKPDSAGSKTLQNQIDNSMQPGTAGARYIAAPEIVGPAGAKQRVFDEAAGEAVLCMDSHVLLLPGAIARLLQWYAAHPDSLDLLSGPLMYDNLNSLATHFIDFWRGEMWGIWGQAWKRTNDGMTNDGMKTFSVLDVEGHAQLIELLSGAPADFVLGHSSLDISPPIPYAGHEKILLANGFRPLGFDPDDEFEIPGQGMGLFTCRKDAWLGFNPNFRGFGGEEMYIHTKFRHAGRKCLCLGFLKWLHRFARPGGVKYPLTRWNKVRNYVLGHVELGLSLDPVHEHFVASGLMAQIEWDALVENPNRTAAKPEGMPGTVHDALSTSLDAGPPFGLSTLEEIYADTKSKSLYMSSHLDKLRDLASQCEVVEEVSRYRETTVALFAGKPKILRSHLFGDGCHDPVFDRLAELAAENGVETFSRETTPDCQWPPASGLQPYAWTVGECDLLFYKTGHDHKELAADLAAWLPKVKRWFAIHDTASNGALLPVMRNFVAANPEWFVYHHDHRQFGLTVLGRQPSDAPRIKVHAWHPGFGPGTELKKILADIGVNPAPSCDCNGKALQMDLWGVEGCRENFDTVVGWMREGQDRWGWKEKLAIAAKAVASGLAFKLNPLDPFPGLVEEAIRRTAEHARHSADFGKLRRTERSHPVRSRAEAQENQPAAAS